MNDSRRKIQVQMDCHHSSPCCLLTSSIAYHLSSSPNSRNCDLQMAGKTFVA